MSPDLPGLPHGGGYCLAPGGGGRGHRWEGRGMGREGEGKGGEVGVRRKNGQERWGGEGEWRERGRGGEGEWEFM